MSRVTVAISVLRARRALLGAAVSAVLIVALGAAMLPLRARLGVATTALVLVVPVVAGVSAGGLASGLFAAGAGLAVYALVFVPPFYDLAGRDAAGWAAPAAYAVVAVLVATVVSRLEKARREAQRRSTGLRRLLDLSERLVRDAPFPDLLSTIAATAMQAFDASGAALLVPAGGGLRVAASAGVPLTAADLGRLTASGVPVNLGSAGAGPERVHAVALSTAGGAVGLLALRGLPPGEWSRDQLRAFADHLALALEGAQLREQATRAELLEEIDRLRRSLVGAVSHDLRTPLATIKVSASALLDPSALGPAETAELAGLVDAQADRLERLVTNLLDMTRIQSGALEVRRRPTAVGEVVGEALAALGPAGEPERVRWEEPPGVPLLDADPVLTCQALANLIDNATRYSPGGKAVVVTARSAGAGQVEVSVTDRGPGFAPGEGSEVFQTLGRSGAGGRGGLGLAISRAFIEAQGGRIRAESGDPGGGARLSFTLPAATAQAAGRTAAQAAGEAPGRGGEGGVAGDLSPAR